MNSRILPVISAILTFLAVTNVSFSQDRTLGAKRILLDDGTNTLAGRVFMTDNKGSLGIDANGNINATFPDPCALLDLSSTTKGLLIPRMSAISEAALC